MVTLKTGKSSSGIAVEDTGIMTGTASSRSSFTLYKVGRHKQISMLNRKPN